MRRITGPAEAGGRGSGELLEWITRAYDGGGSSSAHGAENGIGAPMAQRDAWLDKVMAARPETQVQAG